MFHLLDKQGSAFCPPHWVVMVAAVTSHPGWLIVAGTTALFLGSAFALLLARGGLYDRAGWSESMKANGRRIGYAGAFAVFLGVFFELGPEQKVLKAFMVIPTLLCLLWLLGSSMYLGLRERSKKNEAQEEQTASATVVMVSLMACLGWLLARRVLLRLRAHAEKPSIQENRKPPAD